MYPSPALVSTFPNAYHSLSLLSRLSGLPVSTVGTERDSPFGAPKPAQVQQAASLSLGLCLVVVGQRACE